MKTKQQLLLVLFTLLFAVPSLVLGYNEVQNGLQTSGLGSFFGFGGSSLSSASTLGQLIAFAIRLMLSFAGMIAVVFVIYGGYLYITAGGNDEQAEKGKTALINAILRIVVVIMSYVIINVITNFVSSPGGGI